MPKAQKEFILNYAMNGNNTIIRMCAFGGKVFVVMPVNGIVEPDIEKKILAERDLLLKFPPKCDGDRII